MRRFELHRDVDVSGVSGTGVVAEGVQFADGTCAMRWLSVTPSSEQFRNVIELSAVHGHDGLTKVLWLDAEVTF